MILDTLIDVIIDTLKLLPFLYITYLLMEYLEDKAEDKMVNALKKYEKAGPIVGAGLGIIPQCGFSAAAASLFAGGIITEGTLIAIFLSTSDEMLPIMLSEAIPVKTITGILVTKLIFAAVFGFLVDIIVGIFRRNRQRGHFHDMCEREDCHCEEGNIWKSALIHTAHVTVFIFIISLAFAYLVAFIGEDNLAAFIGSVPYIGILVCGLIGLIPNCAASVMITELYIKGIIAPGQMIAGLMVGAGVGLLVLFRTNTRVRQNLWILVVLYLCGAAAGFIIDLAGIRF